VPRRSRTKGMRRVYRKSLRSGRSLNGDSFKGGTGGKGGVRAFVEEELQAYSRGKKGVEEDLRKVIRKERCPTSSRPEWGEKDEKQ